MESPLQRKIFFLWPLAACIRNTSMQVAMASIMPHLLTQKSTLYWPDLTIFERSIVSLATMNIVHALLHQDNNNPLLHYSCTLQVRGPSFLLFDSTRHLINGATTKATYRVATHPVRGPSFPNCHTTNRRSSSLRTD